MLIIITLCQDQAFHSDVQEVWFYLLQVSSISILSLLSRGRNQNFEPHAISLRKGGHSWRQGTGSLVVSTGCAPQLRCPMLYAVLMQAVCFPFLSASRQPHWGRCLPFQHESSLGFYARSSLLGLHHNLTHTLYYRCLNNIS